MTEAPALRTGWTTGACAAAATKSALLALLTGRFADPVQITLPRGQTPWFALCDHRLEGGVASAAIVKDAGDDPDVTHQAVIRAAVRFGRPGSGVTFRAGEGVGMVTKPGLPIPPGDPAINPVPRAMMDEVVAELCADYAARPDIEITISVDNGAELAKKTWNPRLGIVGGLSILGTTGVVRPFSCAAWIASIHRGVDVARAAGMDHVCGATGAASERAAMNHYGLPLEAMLDMGDFAGGLLKYLRRNPVPRLTIAGGIGKLVKLGQGAMDLHSGRSQVDFARLADLAATAGYDPAPVMAANTALEAFTLCGEGLAQAIAAQAQAQATAALAGAPVAVDVIVVDRGGAIVAHAR